MSLESLFERPAALPVVPQVVQSLIASFQQEDVSVQAIAAQLERDPVLSAKTLRLANSAYFHVSRRVETLDDALRLLGFVMVRNLVLAAGIGQAFKGVQGLDLPLFWRHSLCTAGGARWLAGLTEVNADQAFITGLVQGLGHLVMRSEDPQALASLDRDCPPLHPQRAGIEQGLLGYHHGQVAAELARRWNFPEGIAGPLAALPLTPCSPSLASAPAAPGDSGEALLAVLRAALWNARRECLPPPVTPETTELPPLPAPLALVWDGTPPQLGVQIGRQAPKPVPPRAELAAELEGCFDGA